MNDDAEGGNISPRLEIPHYHGDNTRILFVMSAILIIVAKSTGAYLPLSTTVAVIAAIVLVIVAGITNPRQGEIHWINALLAASGTIIFGVSAINHYRAGVGLLDPSFIYVEILALLSLISLYFTTRTIRGFYLRSNLS